jgi:glycosyltransferase involved in cell wall biosynthesis
LRRILVDGAVLQYAHTGVAKVTLGLYRALLSLDPALEISIVCRGSGANAIPDGIAQVPVPGIVPLQVWRSGVMPWVTRSKKPDVVHFPWNGRVGPFLRASVVTTVHDVLPLAIAGYFAGGEEEQYRRGLSRDLARTDILITDSEFSRNEIVRHFRPAADPVVVSPATDITEVPVGEPAGPSAGYFLYVGGYARRKGIDDLLRVFVEGHRTGRLLLPLLLTGEPHHVTEECSRMIAEGKEKGFVEEKGYVDERQLATLYRHATALVYPSQYEGFGLPPLEAMALGCPVVTTRATSLPEVCGDAAVYVDPFDTVGFLEALRRIESDAQFRRDLAERGLIQSRQFSWKKSAEIFLGLIRAHVR